MFFIDDSLQISFYSIILKANWIIYTEQGEPLKQYIVEQIIFKININEANCQTTSLTRNVKYRG